MREAKFRQLLTCFLPDSGTLELDESYFGAKCIRGKEGVEPLGKRQFWGVKTGWEKRFYMRFAGVWLPDFKWLRSLSCASLREQICVARGKCHLNTI